MAHVTQILSEIDSGDPSAAKQLLPLAYDELRQLAAAKLAQESRWRNRSEFLVGRDEIVELLLQMVPRTRLSTDQGTLGVRRSWNDDDSPCADQ